MTCTRPDLCYVVSQNLSKPTKSHCGMAKQVLRYLKGTYDRCLKFVKGPQLKLVGYSDSDWAMSDDRRSIINQSIIYFNTLRQRAKKLVHTNMYKYK